MMTPTAVLQPLLLPLETGNPIMDGITWFAERFIGLFNESAKTFTGLVTGVVSDTVMSQVTLQCGPFRVVSLISTEAVRDLGLEVGSVATAVVKATNVHVETPRGRS